MMDTATVFILLPKEQLVLQGADSQTVSLPMDAPITFTLTGKFVGRSNVLLYVSGINKNTKEVMTLSQQIDGIEIQALTPWWLKLFSNSLFGVLIGALLTFGTTLVNDYRQSNREKKQRKQWLIANLPAQLEANRIAVEQGKAAQFETWISKLLTEGYYAELRDLAEQKNIQNNLVHSLIEISFCLHDYEHDRTRMRLTKEKQETLASKLSETIEILGDLRKDNK